MFFHVYPYLGPLIHRMFFLSHVIMRIDQRPSTRRKLSACETLEITKKNLTHEPIWDRSFN